MTATAKSEVKKSAGKVAKAAPKAKKALKRMVSETDAEVASECIVRLCQGRCAISYLDLCTFEIAALGSSHKVQSCKPAE